MKNELISVIVPCYNIESFVAGTVKTICNQTYKNLEIILVNDGSTDGTGKVIDELSHRDGRIRVIHKENGGVTSARLEGVREAKGEWIGFVDGDDAIDADMYERLLKNARSSGADIAHCGYKMVFPSRIDYYYNTGRLVKQDKTTGLKDLLSGEFIEPGLWNKLFRKTLFHGLLYDSCMDLSIKNTEDLLMNYYLFREAKVSIYEDFCPYHYMVRENSAATGNPNRFYDCIKVTDILIEETNNEAMLCSIVKQKLIRQLISVSIIDTRNGDEKIRSLQKQSLKRLRKSFLHIIFSKEYRWKLKVMALWVSLSPRSYRLVHNTYLRIKGLDKIYEIS